MEQQLTTLNATLLQRGQYSLQRSFAPLVPKVSWITSSDPSAMELGDGGTFRMCHLVWGNYFMGLHLQKGMMPGTWAWVRSPGPRLVIMRANVYKVRQPSMFISSSYTAYHSHTCSSPVMPSTWSWWSMWLLFTCLLECGHFSLQPVSQSKPLLFINYPVCWIIYSHTK
jgi:hypothetical protein